jgi:uncharacterized integral membrane protein
MEPVSSKGFHRANPLTGGDHRTYDVPTSDTSAPDLPPAPPAPPTTSKSASVTRRSRISGIWVTVIVATVLLVFLLVFILQNLLTVTVAFLGLSGELPLGVALLFAAIVGALLVILVGAARILQLRRRVHRANHSDTP